MTTSALYNVCNNTAGSGNSTVTATVGSGSGTPVGTNAGDTVWVLVANSGSAGQAPTAPTDTQGTTYTLQASRGNSGSVQVFLYSGVPPNPLVSGTDIVTGNWTTTGSSKFMFVKAASGIASATVDASSVNSGTSTAPTSNASGTPAQASEVVLGGIYNATGASLSAPSFGTALTLTQTNFLTEIDQVISAATAQTASATLSASVAWVALVATFKISLPSIATTGLPSATSGNAYSFSLTPSGGLPNYTYAITVGSLTGSGLTLSSAGVISGTAAGGTANYTCTYRVTDGNGNTATKSLTLSVVASGGFTHVQDSAAASGTGSVSPSITASTAGNLLVAVVEAAAAGPFTAPAGWKQAIASGGSPVFMGERNASFDLVTGAGVTGMTTAIAYVGSAGPTTEGIPTGGWPTSVYQSDVKTQIFDYQPNIPDTLNGNLDTLNSGLMTSAPAGSWIMPYHEPGVGASQAGLTPAQFHALDIYLIAMKNRVAPSLLYGRGAACGGGTPLQPSSVVIDTGYSYSYSSNGTTATVFTSAALFATQTGASSVVNGLSVTLNATSKPAGFNANQVYYVVGASGNTFNLALTVGGAGIIGTSGSGSGGTVAPAPDFFGMDGYQHDKQTIAPDDHFGAHYAAAVAVNPNCKLAIIETCTAVGTNTTSGGGDPTSVVGVTRWLGASTWVYQGNTYGPGILGWAQTHPNLFSVNTYFEVPGGTPGNTANPGGQLWQNSFAPAEQALSTGLAALGGNDVEIWYYPNNPGGITSATFTGPAGVLCRGGMSEFASPAGTTQALDGTPGSGGSSGPATSLSVNVNPPTANDLIVGGWGNWFSSSPGGTWTSPTGYTRANADTAGASLYDFEYKLSGATGSQNVAAVFSTSTNQTSWAGAVAAFKAVFAAPVITTSSPLAQGVVGVPYVQANMTSSGGVAPITFSDQTNLDPPGLNISTAGAWTGTPTKAGTYTFLVTATDANGASSSKSFTIVINPALVINTSGLAGGTVGTLYSNPNMSANGGVAPVTWSVSSGALPTGVTLSSAGVWGGTPSTTTGSPFAFTILATDANGNTASKSFSITVQPSGTPPPPSSTQFPLAPLPIMVELLLASTWTDITDYVYTRDSIVISGGQTQEGDTPQKAQCTMTVNNRDGRFSPNLSSSPFYPNLQRGVQLRVSVVNVQSLTNQTYTGYRFWGTVEEWPPQSDVTEQDVFVSLTASGPLRQISTGGGKGGALFRYYQNLYQQDQLNGTFYAPVAYWPCEEDPDSSFVGAGIDGGIDMVVSSPSGNTPAWKTNNSFNGSAPMGCPNKTTWDGLTGSFGASGDDLYVVPGTYNWLASTPTVLVNCMGGGGAGTKGQEGSSGGNGGGGAEFASDTVNVTPGKLYQINVGSGGAAGAWNAGGGNGQSSSFQGDSGGVPGTGLVIAHGGQGASANGNHGSTAPGGTGSANNVHHNGGTGGFDSGAFNGGAGGGGAGGDTGNGGNGQNSQSGSNANGGTGGTGVQQKGGAGGFGGYQVPGQPGRFPGGGGGGGWATQTTGQHSLGGNGGAGQVEMIYQSGLKGTPPPWNVLRFLMQTPPWGGNNNGVLVRMFTPSPAFITKLDVVYVKPGKLQMKGYTGTGGTTLNFTSSNLTFGLDGTPLMVSVEVQNISTTQCKFVLKAIMPGQNGILGSVSQVVGSSGTPAQIFNVTEVVVSPNADITKTAIGHVSVQYQFISIYTVSDAMNGHFGEMGIDRFIRLCGEAALGNAVEYDEDSDHWGFEGGTQGWTGANCSLATSTFSINSPAAIGPSWPIQGTQSLQLTSTASGTFSAIGPTGQNGQNILPGDILTFGVDVVAPVALNDAFVGVQFYNAQGAAISTPVITTAPVAISANNIYTLRGKTSPSSSSFSGGAPAGAAFWAIVVGNSDASAPAGTVMYIDNVRVSPRMGTQTREAYQDYLEQIKDLEQGMMKEAKELWGLKYRTRIQLLNQSPVVQLDHNLGQVSPDLLPVQDDKLTVNHVTVRRKSGSRVTIQQTQGQMSTALPPKGVGKHAKQAKVVAEDDGQLLALASHLLGLGTDVSTRYPTITCDLTRTAMASILPSVALAEIGDFVEIINLPFWYPEPIAKQLVIGYKETLSQFEWTITWNCTPELPWEITETSIRRW